MFQHQGTRQYRTGLLRWLSVAYIGLRLMGYGARTGPIFKKYPPLRVSIIARPNTVCHSTQADTDYRLQVDK